MSVVAVAVPLKLLGGLLASSFCSFPICFFCNYPTTYPTRPKVKTSNSLLTSLHDKQLFSVKLIQYPLPHSFPYVVNCIFFFHFPLRVAYALRDVAVGLSTVLSLHSFFLSGSEFHVPRIDNITVYINPDRLHE